MRFLFYDAITRIEKGKTIEGVKTFALSEEFFRNHFSMSASIPGVIFIEAMAQLLGWLVIHSHDFKLSAIMVLVRDVVVPPRMRPGFCGEIRGEILSSSTRDTMGRAEIWSGGERIAWMDQIVYGHFDRVDPQKLKRLFAYYSGVNQPRLKLGACKASVD